MTLLEKLKGLFTRDEIPDEAKAIFDKATTPGQLLKGLDELLTRNEVEAKELNDEMTKIEIQANEEEEQIRSGALQERQKRNALLHVKRLRKTMDNYEGRLRIYERNMNLHLNLIGKIQQIEAMKLGGVDEQKIDQIVMDFEEKLEKYADVMNAAEAHEGKHALTSAREDRELRQLEQEIIGKKPLEPAEIELHRKERELAVEAAAAPGGTDAPRPDYDRTRRRAIEDVVDEALEDGGRGRPSPEKKKLELE